MLNETVQEVPICDQMLATVFQLKWSGSLSNSVFVAECGFIALLAGVALRHIFKTLRRLHSELIANLSLRTIIGACFAIIWLVVPGVASNGNPVSVGATQGALQNQPANNPRIMLACAILGVPLALAILANCVFFEWPLAVSVTPSRIELLYRLPSRNESINVASITQLSLECKDIGETGGFKAKQYTILICHNGVITRIRADGGYETQLKDAFDKMQSNTALARSQR